MENIHSILYKITVGCVCLRGAWQLGDALPLLVGHMKVLIYGLLFKFEGFSVHCISFYGTEYLGGVSVAPQFTSGCLITANNKIYLVVVKQRNRNS